MLFVAYGPELLQYEYTFNSGTIMTLLKVQLVLFCLKFPKSLKKAKNGGIFQSMYHFMCMN